MSRYPELKFDAGGKLVCRGCGGPVPKGRKTWCSAHCFRRHDPQTNINATLRRDGHKCVICGALGDEVDHIIPFSEGGTFDLSNLRTLCRAHHKARTRQWHLNRHGVEELFSWKELAK